MEQLSDFPINFVSVPLLVIFVILLQRLGIAYIINPHTLYNIIYILIVVVYAYSRWKSLITEAVEANESAVIRGRVLVPTRWSVDVSCHSNIPGIATSGATMPKATAWWTMRSWGSKVVGKWTLCALTPLLAVSMDSQ